MDILTPSRAREARPRTPHTHSQAAREVPKLQSNHEVVQELLDPLPLLTAEGYLVSAPSQNATIGPLIDNTSPASPLTDNHQSALSQSGTLRADSIIETSISPSGQVMVSYLDRMSDTAFIADIKDIQSWLEKNPSPWEQTVSIPTAQFDSLIISSFMNACQERQTQPVLDYDEAGPQRFAARVEFGEHSVTSKVPIRRRS